MKVTDFQIGDRFRIKTKTQAKNHYIVTGHRKDDRFEWLLVRDLNDNYLASTSFCSVNIDWWASRNEIELAAA